MIELNSKTQQDFLNREWVQRLLDAGVDMSDAKYFIGKWNSVKHQPDMIFSRERKNYFDIKSDNYALPEIHFENVIPTYTVSELLYKLHEWIYPTIDGKEFSGGLRFIKDAPFYICYYKLVNREKWYTTEGEERTKTKSNNDYIYAEFEYPIESLASLLLQCHKKDIGIKNKEGKQISDTGNISDK